MVFKKSDLTYLKNLTSKRDRNKEDIKKVIDLYEQRKIPRKDTAELLILKLQSVGKKKNKDALEKLESYQKKEPITGSLKKTEDEAIRVRIVGKRKAEAVEKIKQKFRDFKEPKIKYKNLDKALTHVEFSLDHLKTEEIKIFMTKITPKIKSELNKILIIKSNVKVGLGVNATFMKHYPIYEENKITVKTKNVAVYSKDTADSITDKLVDDVIELFDNIVHKGTGWVKKNTLCLY